MKTNTNNTQEKQDFLKEFEVENQDTSLRIIVRTVVSFFIVLMLLCALFVSSFPYRSMQFYFNMGNNMGALHHARRVVKRYGQQENPAYDSRFADSLFLAQSITSNRLDNSIENRGLNSAITQRYARIAYNYLSLTLNSHLRMTRYRTLFVIDDLRLSSAILRSHHPHLYRYESVLRTRYVRAAYINNSLEPLLSRLYANSKNLSSLSMYEVTYFLIELNTLIQLGHFNVLIEHGQISPILQNLKASTEVLISQIEQASSLSIIEQENRYLRRTWMALHLSNLTTTIRNTLGTLRSRYPQNEVVSTAFTNWVTYNDTISIYNSIVNEYINIPLAVWYNLVILPDYVGRE